MKKYSPSTPRVAAGLTAVAMGAITMGALVALPAKLESVGAAAFTTAQNAVTRSPVDVTASKAGRNLAKTIQPSIISFANTYKGRR